MGTDEEDAGSIADTLRLTIWVRNSRSAACSESVFISED
jgi:hypothetical protein